MVRTVVSAVSPLGVMEDGAKRHTAPEGRPPLQAKTMVEWNPPVGFAVRITGLEVFPRVAVVEAAEGDSVKEPTEFWIVKGTGAEVLV